MRISEWSSDVCSSDLRAARGRTRRRCRARRQRRRSRGSPPSRPAPPKSSSFVSSAQLRPLNSAVVPPGPLGPPLRQPASTAGRSEEHTSELQSLMRISYAVFCLQKKIYKIIVVPVQQVSIQFRYTQVTNAHTYSNL